MLNGAVGVTVSRNNTGGAVAQAKEWAAALRGQYIERPHNLSVPDLLEQRNLAALVVVESAGPRVHCREGSFAYHPSMASLRVQNLQRGGQDHLVSALGLRPGLRVLDCTLGLGSDAAVASYVVGAAGRVVGLEASPLLHFAVRYGLANYETKDAELNAALRRIQTFNTTAASYLKNCAPDSFDAVYFDPMFRRPVSGSKNMDALRPLAWEQPLEKAVVELALRAAPVAVIKERGVKILQSYGCREFVGGKYSRVVYGVVRR